MGADFLGQGWKFPIALSKGAFVRASAEASIEESVLLILGTAKGERIMRPEFGCGIGDHVFAPNTSTTRSRIADEIEDALIRWEPRIDLLGVEVETAADEPNTLLVGIRYQVRATNSVFNLVYPFYLNGAPHE